MLWIFPIKKRIRCHHNNQCKSRKNKINEFEKIVNDIEERVYQLFNNGEIVDAKNTAIDNLIENFGGENFREEFTKKLSEYGDNPTKYNPKAENYGDIDALFNFLNIISYSPK